MGRSREGSGGRGRSQRAQSGQGNDANGVGPGAAIPAPGTTGRYLVLLREGAEEAGLRAVASSTGLQVASSADFEGGAIDPNRLTGAEAVFFDRLGVAVVDAPPEQFQAMSATAAQEDAILAVEPERIVYALADDPSTSSGIWTAAQLPASSGIQVGADYLLGYREAVNHLVDSVLGLRGTSPAAEADVVPATWDESQFTWGLQATRVASSQYGGNGAKVTVLDTGLDLQHPDFVGRPITAKSFVAGEDVQDGHGHGTHTIGTACGPREPQQLPRYGIAYEAEIFAGKVLNNQGSGADGGILAGITWAIANGCTVVSMSLGAELSTPNQGYSRVFETVARRALAAGTVIIAAAGNGSHRPWDIRPVGHPANCPSIMAVGALDPRLQVTSFSNAGLNPAGGQVDIAAPGLNVRSSWPRPILYRTISGTSMATPHVSGIAALFAEANPQARGRLLTNLLTQNARRLVASSRDVGAGLVQAP